MSVTESHSRPAEPSPPSVGVDPRAPQLAAALTSVVLLAALLTPAPVSVALTAVQAVLFGLGAALGVRRTPYAWLFRTLVRPRLAPPAELEDPRPPRFAQLVGFSFTAVALAAYLLGLPVVATVAVGLALVAALLNAVFRFCLGCELYLRIRRLA